MRGLSRWPSDKESTCNAGYAAGAMGLIPGSGRSPEGGNVNPTKVLLLGKSHGQSSLAGYSSWDHRVGPDLATEHET